MGNMEDNNTKINNMENQKSTIDTLVQILENIVNVQKENIKGQLEQYKTSEASMRYDAEELECVKMWLDDQDAPKEGEKGKYSVIGRIKTLINNIHKGYYDNQ